jgi:hypothetical protein
MLSSVSDVDRAKRFLEASKAAGLYMEAGR